MTADPEKPHVHGPDCNHDHDHEHEHEHEHEHTPVRRVERPGRNDACWCESGRKYKKCHFAADEAAIR